MELLLSPTQSISFINSTYYHNLSQKSIPARYKKCAADGGGHAVLLMRVKKEKRPQALLFT
jgi:hypothetical protein